MLRTLAEAVSSLAPLDPELLAIAWLPFQVSLEATALGAIFGLFLVAWIAVAEFPGRTAVTVLMNGLLGMPPVVLGVIVYQALSRSGPLGPLGGEHSPTARFFSRPQSQEARLFIRGELSWRIAFGD